MDQQDSERLLHKAIEISEDAKKVIENEAFKLAYDQLRAFLLVQWESTKPTEVREREAIWGQMKAADLFIGNLKDLMEFGKIARVNLTQVEKNNRITQFLKRVNN